MPWDAAQQTGSRVIFVWETTDLVKWGNERLYSSSDTIYGNVFQHPNVIDLDILALDSAGNNYLRSLKDKSATTVFVEYSKSGLFGSWARAGGSSGIITSRVEGPAAYRDNQVDAKAHVLLDFYGSDGYRPYESTNPKGDVWTASDRSAFPSNLGHGSLLPINQTLYNVANNK
ncbi:hypothetical protein AB5N19_05782 [Seiridium cardinale]|uniref:Uncharacterized protein n=1 Tax=Seiridium cardinale TaxID=138064 RepID=A0ABR2XHB9_9PEZI